jgi:hypothetical protein
MIKESGVRSQNPGVRKSIGIVENWNSRMMGLKTAGNDQILYG